MTARTGSGGRRCTAAIALLGLGITIPVLLSPPATAGTECVPTAPLLSVVMTKEHTTTELVRAQAKGKFVKRGVQVRITRKIRVTTTQTFRTESLVDQCLEGVSEPSKKSIGFTLQAVATVTNKVMKKARTHKAATKKATAVARRTGLRAGLLKARKDLASRVPAAARSAVSGLLSHGHQKVALRAAIFAEINKRRVQHGLYPLRYLVVAEALTDDWMETVKDGPYKHDPNQNADWASLGCNAPLDGFPPADLEALHWGSQGSIEHIAFNVVHSWMNSPGHRAALLDQFTIWGTIGLAYSGAGEYWAIGFRSSTANCSNI